MKPTKDVASPGKQSTMQATARSELGQERVGGALGAPPLTPPYVRGPYNGRFEEVYANALRQNDSTRCWLGVRIHAPPKPMRCLPAPPASPVGPRKVQSRNWNGQPRSSQIPVLLASPLVGLQSPFPARPSVDSALRHGVPH